MCIDHLESLQRRKVEGTLNPFCYFLSVAKVIVTTLWLAWFLPSHHGTSWCPQVREAGKKSSRLLMYLIVSHTTSHRNSQYPIASHSHSQLSPLNETSHNQGASFASAETSLEQACSWVLPLCEWTTNSMCIFLRDRFALPGQKCTASILLQVAVKTMLAISISCSAFAFIVRYKGLMILMPPSHNLCHGLVAYL